MPKSKTCHASINIYNWGALIQRAEIIPFEPARIMPHRDEEKQSAYLF